LEWIIKNKIRLSAQIYGIDPDLALKVCQCESNFDPFAIRFNSNGSVDRGLYQINDYWHPEVSDEQAFNYEFSIDFFCQAVKAGNLYWWNSSKKCWSKS
jgi:soluble lytic murein transglycosylase-like protein